jgi:hypothetical protein
MDVWNIESRKDDSRKDLGFIQNNLGDFCNKNKSVSIISLVGSILLSNTTLGISNGYLEAKGLESNLFFD